MISIIMPIRNASSFLNDCIDSILAQTHTDWELLAVNDYSVDNTLDILNDYAKKDNRIAVLANDGYGIIEALQTGYRASKGNFITRMDADDNMPPTKLEILCKALENSPKNSIVTGYVQYISESIVESGFKRYENWLNKLVDTNSYYTEIYKECVIASPAWLIDRSTFETCGGFEGNDYPEDYDLVFRLYKNHVNVVGVKEIVHIWRDHPKRASRTDPHYTDSSFIDLKTKYFAELDYDSKKQLIIWGAGKKGKKIANILRRKDIEFKWITSNENKIGHNINGLTVEAQSKHLKSGKTTKQFVIAIAGPGEQTEIKFELDKIDNKEVFWFC